MTPGSSPAWLPARVTRPPHTARTNRRPRHGGRFKGAALHRPPPPTPPPARSGGPGRRGVPPPAAPFLASARTAEAREGAPGSLSGWERGRGGGGGGAGTAASGERRPSGSAYLRGSRGQGGGGSAGAGGLRARAAANPPAAHGWRGALGARFMTRVSRDLLVNISTPPTKWGPCSSRKGRGGPQIFFEGCSNEPRKFYTRWERGIARSRKIYKVTYNSFLE